MFDAICNSCWFTNTSIIMFLNKIDLFKKKIQRKKSIKLCFEEYEGKDGWEK